MSMNGVGNIGRSVSAGGPGDLASSPSRSRGTRSSTAGGESSVPAPQALRIKAFVDDETGRPGFVVIDDASGEVVREIPTEEALELAAKLKQITGLLVNEAV